MAEKWGETIGKKKILEKERLQFDINIHNGEPLYQFMLELQPTNVNSYQLNELVKCYKDISKSVEERKDVKLEIFRACFKMMYFYSIKNTYTKKSYNDGDIIFGMWSAFEYLLDKFEFKVYKTKKGVQTGCILSFRNYLKKFYGAKFHRYCYQSSKFGTTPLNDLIWKSHNKVKSDSLDRLRDKNIEVKYCEKCFVDIEYQDSLESIKDELIQLVNESLSPLLAGFILYKFKLSQKRYRYKKGMYDYDSMMTVALGMLRQNPRIKELFKTIQEYNYQI